MVKKKVTHFSEKRKQKIPVIEEEFTGRNLTPFGGAGVIRRFFEKHGLKERLSELEVPGRRESEYSPGQIFLSIIFGVVLGKNRPSHMEVFRSDQVFQRLAGLLGFPVPSTITRFLGGLKVSVARSLAGINRELRHRFRCEYKDRRRITLDLDSHVTTVYGNQQRADLGWNPKKKGRKSFHPLLCFDGETRDYLGGKFRSGSSHTGKGAVDFVKGIIKGLPEHSSFRRLRADSGFFSLEFLKFLADNSIEYFVVVPLQPWVQRLLKSRRFKSHNRRLAFADFKIELGRKLVVRLVAVRKKLRSGERPKKNLKLFGGMEAIYDYQVIATGSASPPLEVWQTYNKRACCENFIKEGIYSFGLDRIVSHNWAGNRAWFELLMISYNLMNWFKETAAEEGERGKPMWSTLRDRLIIVVGRLVFHSGRYKLKLPREWPHREEFERLRLCLG